MSFGLSFSFKSYLVGWLDGFEPTNERFDSCSRDSLLPTLGPSSSLCFDYMQMVGSISFVHVLNRFETHTSSEFFVFGFNYNCFLTCI